MKKPKEFYEENNSTIVINGGFFYEGSLSLIWRNGEMVCKNNDVTAEDWTNGPFWYPVLAAFCEMNDGLTQHYPMLLIGIRSPHR